MPHSTASVQSVGVDTLTCSAGEDGNLDHLRELGVDLLMRSAERKNRVGYFKRGPYVGGQTRQIGYGEHNGRGLVELRGELAREWWPEVLPLAGKVSRIDVQVTVRQEPYDSDLAWRAWEAARTLAKMEGRPPRYTLWADASRGSTLYVGRLGSRFLGRLYEKGKEDPKGGWGDSWRYEVQARRERAEQVAAELGGASEREATMAALVHSHFGNRGVAPIFDPGKPFALAPLPPEATDTAKSLTWLAKSVAPVIQRLYSAGEYDAALKVLGIGETLEHP